MNLIKNWPNWGTTWRASRWNMKIQRLSWLKSDSFTMICNKGQKTCQLKYSSLKQNSKISNNKEKTHNIKKTSKQMNKSNLWRKRLKAKMQKSRRSRNRWTNLSNQECRSMYHWLRPTMNWRSTVSKLRNANLKCYKVKIESVSLRHP